MTATYRLIHVQLDPFLKNRIVIGAVVVGRNGEVRVAHNLSLPSAECLGSEQASVVMQRLTSRLGSVTDESATLMQGPFTLVSEPSPIPDGVNDPLEWVQRLLNPSTMGDKPLSQTRGSHRSTFGFRFFEVEGVSRFVHKGFKPGRDMDGWLGSKAGALDQITHWVPGERRVLLMEPIVLTRPSLTQDLRVVAQRFGAYQHAMRGTEIIGSLVAYITPAGSSGQRQEAHDVLEGFADEVYDTQEPNRRRRLVDMVREYAVEGNAQPELTN